MTTKTMSKLDKLHPVPNSEMKAVIIYDDIVFAAQANTTLQHAGHRADVNVRWNIKPWRLNDLNDHAAGGKALMDAADAHLIVLAGRGAESLPSWLRDWLTRWADIRQIPDAALAVIGNTNAGLSRPVSRELSRFVREHGLTFIIDDGPAAKDAVKLFIRHSREPKLPAAPENSGFDQQESSASNRHWGINE